MATKSTAVCELRRHWHQLSRKASFNKTFDEEGDVKSWKETFATLGEEKISCSIQCGRKIKVHGLN